MRKETFTRRVKSEMLLSSSRITKKCCRLSLLYGLLITANRFETPTVRFITENAAVADFFTALLGECFPDTHITREAVGNGEKSEQRISADADGIIARLSDTETSEKISTYRINKSVFMCEECAISFLKGVFISCGNVISPKKSYHLEIVVQHFSLSREILYLLKTLGFTPKYTKRGAYYVIYFKESDAIVDILALFGAQKCSFDYTDAKIERDIRNNVNRVQNCDLANMARTANTANRQLEMIEAIISEGKLECLKPELRQTAMIRINNPEASLLELGELHEPPVTKSCVNHRLKKIEEFCEENCRKD